MGCKSNRSLIICAPSSDYQNESIRQSYKVAPYMQRDDVSCKNVPTYGVSRELYTQKHVEDFSLTAGTTRY